MVRKKENKKRTFKALITAAAFILLTAGLLSACSLFSEQKVSEPPQETANAAEGAHRPLNTESVMLTMGAGERLSLPAGSGFSSDNTAVLEIDTTAGVLTANAEGYATLTDSAGKRIYVTVKKAPSAVMFRNSEVTLQKGEQTAFYLIPADNSEGFSGAEFFAAGDVLTVTPDGAVTANAAGTAVVTAHTYNGKSASVNVTVQDNAGYDELTAIADADLLADAAWSAPRLASVPAGSTVRQYGASADGRWRKVKFENQYGWLYNKALENITNYTEYTLDTLPIMADDLIFKTGTDKRALFDFVYGISYGTNEDDTDENLCVDYFRSERGSCYTHGAMLCYLYNRCGYESMRLKGESAYEGAGDHSWCLTKTEEGWRHFDAQYFSIRKADEQFGVKDDTYRTWFHWDRSKTPRAE